MTLWPRKSCCLVFNLICVSQALLYFGLSLILLVTTWIFLEHGTLSCILLSHVSPHSDLFWLIFFSAVALSLLKGSSPRDTSAAFLSMRTIPNCTSHLTHIRHSDSGAKHDHCLSDITIVMAQNFRKLNDNKTELDEIGHP